MASIIQLFRSRPKPKDRFETLLRPHIELMYRMAYRWTQSQSDAEDLVQDVLLKVAGRVDEMERIDSLRPWLIRIVYNRYVDLYRRSRASPIGEASPDPWSADESEIQDRIAQAPEHSSAITQLEQQRALLLGLQALDDEQRDTVLLHDLEGYTAVEVAEIMQTHIGTVKSRLHRARSKLKDIL